MLENINMDNVSWLFAALPGFAEETAALSQNERAWWTLSISNSELLAVPVYLVSTPKGAGIL